MLKTMRSKRGCSRLFLVRSALGLALLALAAAPTYAGPTGYMYVGDYANNQVVRFDDTTGAVVSPDPYIKINTAEGVGGTSTLLAVASPNQINVYNVGDGSNVPPLVRSISTPSYSGLRLAFSNDATNLYSGGIVSSGGQLRDYDFATGTLLHSVNNANGIWGVAVNPITGKVYWTTGWNTGSGGAIFTANSDLSNVTQLVAPGDHGITGLVGITFKADGTFYVVNGGNGDANNDFVNHYSATGVFLDRVSMVGMPSGALYNAFDTEIGPDGNLYVTSQNGACVVKFNTSNDTYNSIFIAPHAGGLSSAKTIHFSINNAVSVPEPSSLLMGGVAGVLGLVVARARRRPRS